MPKDRLTIGIDTRPLQKARTGIYTYLEEICSAFKQLDDPTIEFCFIKPRIPVYNSTNKIFRLVEHVRFQFWKQLMLPIKAWYNKCDIVFCVDDSVPLLHLRYVTVPVFHDAFVFETPQNYGKLWRWIYFKTAVPAARRSPLIIAPTAYAQRQISHYTGIPLQKITVIPEGPRTVGVLPSPVSTRILEKYELNNRHYILHVGSMFKRKNLLALVSAFGRLKEQHGYPKIKLVLAGPIPDNAIDSDHDDIKHYIHEHELCNDVVLTGYLDNSSIDQLYSNALMYVFPSLNEGFGIPILEAFSHDLPVIVANNTCLPEVGGDAVLQFDPADKDDLYKKMRHLLDNENLRHDQIIKGRERLKLYSWQNTACQLVDHFKKVANKSAENDQHRS